MAETLSTVLERARSLLPPLLSLALGRNLGARGSGAVGTNPGSTRSRRRGNRRGRLADGRSRSSPKANSSHSSVQTSSLDVRSDLVKAFGSGFIDVGIGGEVEGAVGLAKQ
jgi:hypothetical protein